MLLGVKEPLLIAGNGKIIVYFTKGEINNNLNPLKYLQTLHSAP